jgi:hypothetical protein
LSDRAAQRATLAAALRGRWNWFWYRPASPLGLIGARVVVALQALWLVLSRPDLTEILAWPRGFWSGVDSLLLLRFGIGGLPVPVERLLYWVLEAALFLGILGLKPRIAGLIAGLLLYHFAPFEDIFASQGGPFFRGFSVSVAALLILSFAVVPRRKDDPSPEYRWPLALIQLLFAFTYLFSGLAKLVAVGPAWASGRNVEGLVLGLIFPEVQPAWAHWFVGRPWLSALGGVAGLFMDFAFLAAVVSRRAARLVVPTVFILHLLIYQVMGVFFPATPLLLLFLDWEALDRRLRHWQPWSRPSVG